MVEELAHNNNESIFINYWHQNEFKSEAMWKMYSTNVNNAIAIQTDFKKLKNELGVDVSINKVKYIEYSKQFANINDAFLRKRKAFEYENEVRAIFHSIAKRGSGGAEYKVNLNKLIFSVYAPEWFYELVQDIVTKYNYSFDGQYSALKQEPF